MPANMARRFVLAYFLAVIVATVLATVVQTQINLHDLQRLGMSIPVGDRLATSGRDLLGFTPFMGLLVAASFMVALPAAGFLGRILRPLRTLLHMLAGGVGIWVAFRITDAIAPPPILVAATREVPGTLAMMAAVGVGGLVFAFLTRPGRQRRPDDPGSTQ